MVVVVAALMVVAGIVKFQRPEVLAFLLAIYHLPSRILSLLFLLFRLQKMKNVYLGIR